jgi:Flp pilus assembly protein TadG
MEPARQKHPRNFESKYAWDSALKLRPKQSEFSSSRNAAHYLVSAERGQSAAEFALVAPVALLLLLAIVEFGIAFNNFTALTFATNTGTQALSFSRGQTTDPCQLTSQAVYSAAPQLTQSNLKFTILLGTNSVASGAANPTCSGSQQYLVQSSTAKVTVTYPCNISIMGYNPVPGCALSASTAVLIQ